MSTYFSSKQSLRTNSSSSQFIFVEEKGADESMKDFAKMTILLAIKEHPEDDHEKCLFVAKKFEDYYKGYWNCSFIKDGDDSFYFDGVNIKIKYEGYTIKIAKVLLGNE